MLEAVEVSTMEKVKVGPVTPLIVVVPLSPDPNVYLKGLVEETIKALPIFPTDVELIPVPPRIGFKTVWP